MAGTVNNVCCESLSRDAMTSHFRMVMVRDGNAAMRRAEHEASSTTVYPPFGEVMDTETLIACLSGTTRLAAYGQPKH